MSASALPRKNRIGRIEYKMKYFIDFVSPGSTEANNGRGEKLDSRLIANYVRNTDVKNY